ncbi:MAG: acyl-CoA/acyl-ACP dehydrogenase [Burkholderiaceae bacterium]|nr:acyl-CoA/acyl-ACP dehydrogenase [Burkholderiaceae bacterium]
MSTLVSPDDPTHLKKQPPTLLDLVKHVVATDLAPITTEIDQGLYPADVMRSLAAVGAMSAHLKSPHGNSDFCTALNAMASISRVCGSTGFLTWCQSVCGLYLQNASSAYLSQTLLEDHVSGFTLGGTALSNPMKSFANIEKFQLFATHTANGYRINGSLPWVSNLGPNHYCAAIAQIQGDSGRQVMFLLRCDGDGVQLQPCPKFSGMEGTGTYALHLQDYEVGADEIIADPAGPWIKRIRPAFVLLQTGWAAGIIQASIASIRAAEKRLGHVNCHLVVQADGLEDQYQRWWQDVMALAQNPLDEQDSFFLRVLKARSTASELCLVAAQAALLHQGAAGYTMSSPVQRRIRESHFVAIVTPALKHLRKEIARLEAQFG